MNIATAILDYASGTEVFGYVSLVFIIPAIAVATRRLHDINRSGWWQLISFGLGFFVLLYLWAEPSQNNLEDKAAVFD